MKPWLMTLAAACCLSQAVLANAAERLAALLANAPAAFAQEHVQKGDIRFMGVPGCSANDVPGMPAEPSAWWKAGDRLEPLTCQDVMGSEALERVKKLQHFAEVYNQTVLAHVRSNGLYPLYPWDAEPNHNLTPAQEKRVAAETQAAMDAFYTHKRPASLERKDDTGVWTTAEGALSRLFVTSQVSAADLQKIFKPEQWRSVATPRDFVRTAHKVAPAYTGKINGKPAYLFVTPKRGGGDAVLVMMVLVYDADEANAVPADGDTKPKALP
ncbi:MAG: hypothetical protein V4627_06540 [Pseudomonadota bacterium]